jgi:predicted dehydrogenase
MARTIKNGEILHVGIIGCGLIAQIEHIPYLVENNALELTAICDISPKLLKAIGEKYHIDETKRYLSVDDMVADQDVDAVLICTKDHYEPAVKAAKAGKHMLIEKPLAYTVKQCQEIVDLAKENHVVLQVGYMKRYDPAFQYALEKIRTIKEVNMVRVHDYGGAFDMLPELFQFEVGSDIPQETLKEGNEKIRAAMLEEIGEDRAHLIASYDAICGVSSHDSILMRHAFGVPEVLYAQEAKEGIVTAILRFENGVQGIFESALLMDRRHWDESFKVYGKECDVSIEFPWPYLKNAPTVVRINEDEPGSRINYTKEVKSLNEEAYRAEWKDFYTCITEGKRPIASGEDGLEEIRFASKVIRAIPV